MSNKTVNVIVVVRDGQVENIYADHSICVDVLYRDHNIEQIYSKDEDSLEYSTKLEMMLENMDIYY